LTASRRRGRLRQLPPAAAHWAGSLPARRQPGAARFRWLTGKRLRWPKLRFATRWAALPASGT